VTKVFRGCAEHSPIIGSDSSTSTSEEFENPIPKSFLFLVEINGGLFLGRCEFFGVVL